MRCLTTAECEQKVQGLHLEIEGQLPRFLDGGGQTSRRFRIPDSARRQALAINALFRTFSDDTSEWLLWALEWGVWPNEEYPELWDEIREHHGERRPVIEAPGHLFAQNEKGLARGMMRLAMLFGWTACLIPNPVSFVVSIDDDEELDVCAAAPATIADLATEITELWTKPW